MVFRSTCSLRNHAGTRLNSRYNGRPEENPVNTQISMRRVNNCCQTLIQSGRALEPVHRHAAKHIGQHAHLAAAGHHTAFKDVHTLAAAEFLEIVQRAQVDVGRVIPLVWQLLGYRHVAMQDVEAVFPVAKVGKADDALAADAQDFLYQRFGVPYGLEGLRQDDEIERTSLEAVQAGVQVALDHIYAVLDTRHNVLVADLHAVTAHLARILEVAQQAAIAAAEVEHRRALRYPRRNGGKVRAGGGEFGRIMCAHVKSPESATDSCGKPPGDALKIGAHHLVVMLVLHQERIVPVGRGDLSVAYVQPVVQQRLDNGARALRRKTPVGGER